MPNSSDTLIQRVAHYAADVILDSLNEDAMRSLIRGLDAHPERKRDPQSLTKVVLPERQGALSNAGTSAAVLAAAGSIRGDISRDSALRKLLRSGHVFNSSIPKKAVGDALQRLCKQGKLVAAGKGPGGKNLYKLPQ